MTKNFISKGLLKCSKLFLSKKVFPSNFFFSKERLKLSQENRPRLEYKEKEKEKVPSLMFLVHYVILCSGFALFIFLKFRANRNFFFQKHLLKKKQNFGNFFSSLIFCVFSEVVFKSSPILFF